MRVNKVHAAVVAALTGATGLTYQPAYAQEGLEEIVVTATRREQNLQEVPISIVAITGEGLEMRGLQNVENLNATVPNLSVMGSAGGGGTSATSFRVRGIPGVGTYIDGVYQVSTAGMLTEEFADLDRLEVLRGPQGTLFGRDNFIDGSARGLPPERNVFYQVKSRETFAPIGPYIVTADEIPDPHNLAIKLWVNGELKQSFNTSDMAYKIPRCIEFVTAVHTLEPGDILATGTNHRGLNAFMDGDKVELETQGLGKLQINVRDPLKRTWSRETRLQRTDKGLEGLTPQLSGKYAKTA